MILTSLDSQSVGRAEIYIYREESKTTQSHAKVFKLHCESTKARVTISQRQQE